MAKFQALSDTFDGGSITPTLWVTSSGAPSVVSGQLNLTVESGGANSESIESLNTYDLTSSFCQIEVVNAGNTGLVQYALYFRLQLDASNELRFFIGQGIIAFTQLVAGAPTTLGSTGHNTTNHRWLRFTESNGFVSWWTSPDSLLWTNQTGPVAVSGLFNISSLKAQIIADVTGSEATPTTAIIDNVNIRKSSLSQKINNFKNTISPYPFSPRRVR